MAKAPTKLRSHKERLQSLYGGMFPSQESLRRATALRQKAFTADFKRQEASRAEYAALTRKLQAPMIEAYRKDTGALEHIRKIQALSTASVKRKLSPPRIPVHAPRIVADLGATVVAPYDFEEVLLSSAGSPFNDSSAQKATGKITSTLSWNNANASSGSVTVGVGIFFHPPTDCPGTLKISSSVAYSSRWSTYSMFAGAHSDGWLGLSVERFTINGFPDGVLIDQRFFLWSNDSSWVGGPVAIQGSNTGFPLFAQCGVDSQHSYHVWVRGGGSVSSAGFGGPFSSFATSQIFGTVPSIAWELV